MGAVGLISKEVGGLLTNPLVQIAAVVLVAFVALGILYASFYLGRLSYRYSH